LTTALRSLTGNADLQVRGPRNGFDEAVYPLVAHDPDVAAASPVVEVDARLDGRDEALRIVGIDAFRAAGVTPALVGSAPDPLDLLRPGRIFLSPAAAQALAVAPGATLDVQSGLRAVPLVVAGLLPATDRQRFGVMDIAAAQDAFARGGRLSRIDLRLRPGAAPAIADARLAAILPAGVTITTPAAYADDTRRLSRAYRVNLDALALVALFTGGLLVYATQTLAVARRRAPLALVRALGLSRRALVRHLVAEGALLGLAGAVIGLVAGYVVATLAVRTFGGDLGAGYFRGVTPTLTIDAWAALAFVVLGVAVAALGSWLPARAWAQAPLASALKAGERSSGASAPRLPRIALALVLVGLAAAALPPVDDLPLAGYLAMALLLAGTLGALPWLAARALAAVPVPRNVPLALALTRLRATPTEAAVSLAAIVAAVALMVSMAIMVASFRHSLTAWLDAVLPADVYVRAAVAGDSGYLSPDVQHAIAGLPGVAGVSFTRTQTVTLRAGTPPVALLARDLPAGEARPALVLVAGPHAATADAPAIWVSEAVADGAGWRPGESIELPLAGRRHRFTVGGIFRDYARQQGALVVERSVYRRLTGDDLAGEAAITLAPGVRVDAFAQALAGAVPEAARMTLATPAALRALSLRIFDRTFAVTYALLAVAIAIGLAGLSSAFAASIVARRREFGVLRHLGMTRRQIARMLVAEGTALTAVGLGAGFVLGGALALVLIHVVNRQSFHWSMDLTVPYALLAALAITLLIAAAATSLASARPALRSDAIAAVKDDW
ncbi:MAG: FtsX-like permease family protein, partial [Burkholderiales bacterium]|nr:FtsX-like permease family protein [Burkholderiales bacterium]